MIRHPNKPDIRFTDELGTVVEYKGAIKPRLRHGRIRGREVFLAGHVRRAMRMSGFKLAATYISHWKIEPQCIRYQFTFHRPLLTPPRSRGR
jgi:hypothetical protein